MMNVRMIDFFRQCGTGGVLIGVHQLRGRIRE
jgi:hypothetical protein